MITQQDLEQIAVFSALPRGMRAHVASRSADIHANAGEWFSRDGDPPYFWGVVSGEVEVLRLVGDEWHQMTTFDPGESFGEIPLVLGAPTFVGLRAIQPSRLARVDAGDFHAMISASPEAASQIAQAMSRRVGLIEEAYAAAPSIRATIVGTRSDLLCHDIRDFLSRNEVPYEWLDPDDEADAECIARTVATSARAPVVQLADGTVLESPTQRDVARALHLQIEPEHDTYDALIVGGGPAGLAASVYGGSEGLRTIMIEREAPGGQAGTSSRIENYLGFPGGISGGDLASRALHQAKRFGTEILVTRRVERIEPGEREHRAVLDGGTTISARSVVIATGVSWRELDADGAEALIGRGVYYGAARTEAINMRDRRIFLVGGGNSAGQAAMFFSSYAREVTLLVRNASLESSMSYYLIEQLRTKSNISVETGTTVVAVSGDGRLDAITTRSGSQERERPADGLFVFIGADAETAWLPEVLERDERGYLRTGADLTTWQLERAPFPLETNVPGIFAAGDVRSRSVKRVAAGVGEGSMVIAFIHEYLAASRELEPKA